VYVRSAGGKSLGDEGALSRGRGHCEWHGAFARGLNVGVVANSPYGPQIVVVEVSRVTRGSRGEAEAIIGGCLHISCLLRCSLPRRYEVLWLGAPM
jgi:hypothetical protein